MIFFKYPKLRIDKRLGICLWIYHCVCQQNTVCVQSTFNKYSDFEHYEFPMHVLELSQGRHLNYFDNS
jgi:hypothetical protein